MRAFKAALLIVASFIMVGCASHPQTPLQLSQGFYTQKNQVVGVYQTHIPEPNTFFPGADCLLCLATAEAMNLSLTDHVHSFETEELNSLTNSVITTVSKQGMKATRISDELNFDELESFKNRQINYAETDFRPLKSQLKVDKLIVIEIGNLGVYRTYNGYVPTSDPLGTVTGKVYLVNLNTNQYELYENLDFKINTEGQWDEPPAYPSVTNAYYTAIEQAKDKVKNLFL